MKVGCFPCFVTQRSFERESAYRKLEMACCAACCAGKRRVLSLELEETKQSQEEIIDGQHSSCCLTQVKCSLKVVITIAVSIVVIIVAAVLTAVFVSSNNSSDNGESEEATIAKSSAALSHFSSSEAKTAKSSAPLSHFSADASIVKSSPSATKSFEVTSYTPSHFHKTTTPPFLKMTSTSLVSFSSTDLPSASTMFSGTTPLPSNTMSPFASITNSSLSSS